MRQEIQDLREGEIRSLGEKINALTRDVQYIKAKLNAMEKSKQKIFRCKPNAINMYDLISRTLKKLFSNFKHEETHHHQSYPSIFRV